MSVENPYVVWVDKRDWHLIEEHEVVQCNDEWADNPTKEAAKSIVQLLCHKTCKMLVPVKTAQGTYASSPHWFCKECGEQLGFTRKLKTGRLVPVVHADFGGFLLIPHVTLDGQLMLS